MEAINITSIAGDKGKHAYSCEVCCINDISYTCVVVIVVVVVVVRTTLMAVT